METSVVENKQEKSSRVKLSIDQETKLLAYIEIAWQMANGARVRWLRDKEEGLQLYWGIRRPKDFPFKNCANLHVPLIRTMAETLHSNIMGSINTEKPASISPIGPEDVPKARKAERVLNWQFSTQIDYHELTDNIVSSCLIYGLAPIKVRYVIEKLNGQKIYDGLKAEVLPPERFLTPPDAINADVDGMEYVMQEIALTKSDLKKRIKSGMYDDVPDEDLDRIVLEVSKTTRQGDDFLENLRGLYSGVDSQFHALPATKYATVVEFYGNYDLDEDGIAEPLMVSMLKEARKILRVVSWDGPRPFVIARFSPILNRATGESVADLLTRINQELNTIHNQRVDAVTLQNIPFFFFDPVAGFNPDEIKLTPGLGIPTNGPPTQAVYVPSLNITRPEMYKEEDMLFEYAERLLGAGSNTQGILESKRVTATEIATIDRRSGIRFLTIFNRIKKSLSDVFKLALEFDRQYMPPEIQVRVSGLDSSEPIFETIDREALAGSFDIRVNGNSVLDDQADRQEQMQVYQIGMMNPLISRDPDAVYELTKDLLIKMNVKNVEAYLRKPENEIPTNPTEEHNLFLQEEYIEPHLAEDIERHLREHADFINSDNFKLLTKKGQLLAYKHYASTIRMKQGIDQMKMINQAMQVNGALMQTQGGQMPGQMMGQVPQIGQQPQGGQPGG